jgi:uncharacterized protein (TIGR02246 family)
MKHFLSTCLLICLAAGLFAQNSKTDEAAIRSIIQKKQDAWNKHDWVAFSQDYTDDATLVNFVGMFWKSKSDIISHLSSINDCCLSATSVKFDLQFFRPVSPGVDVVYIEETLFTDRDYSTPVQSYKKGEIEYKQIIAVYVKKGEEWKVTAEQLTLINQLLTPHKDIK